LTCPNRGRRLEDAPTTRCRGRTLAGYPADRKSRDLSEPVGGLADVGAPSTGMTDDAETTITNTRKSAEPGS
jgi:hypothetical protein